MVQARRDRLASHFEQPGLREQGGEWQPQRERGVAAGHPIAAERDLLPMFVVECAQIRNGN